MSTYGDEGYTEKTISFPTRALDKFKQWIKDGDIRDIYGKLLSVNQGVYSVFMSFVSEKCNTKQPKPYFGGTVLPEAEPKPLFEEPTEVDLLSEGQLDEPIKG